MIYKIKSFDKKMFGIIVLSVCILLPVYLYKVKKDRADSVKTLSVQPHVGDIYKMQENTPEEGEYVYYLRIVAIDDANIHFIMSRLTGVQPNDVLLGQFDPAKQMTRTKEEMLEIAAGKWNIAARDKTEIIEIERR